MSISKLCLLSLTSLILSPLALAQVPMTPLEVFSRCYMQLTGMVPDATSAIYKDVKDLKYSPGEGCAKIFDRAKFNATGVMATSTDPIGRKVLERVHNIHLNWFAIKHTGNFSSATPLLIETEEPALYLTRAAFFPSAKFTDVLTLGTGLQGVRVPSAGDVLPLMQRQKLVGPVPFRDPTRKNADGTPFEYPFEDRDLRIAYDYFDSAASPGRKTRAADLNTNLVVQFGTLVGVKAPLPINFPNFYERLGMQAALRAQTIPTYANMNTRKHFGGGVLGSQGYILMNTNMGRVLTAGEDLMHRRIGSRVYEDFMCHQLPTLNAADVARDVIPTSEYTFRQSSSCMQCHSSMDPTANSYRNLYRSISTSQRFFPGYRFEFIADMPRLNVAGFPSTTAPNGKVDYRTLLTKSRSSASTPTVQDLGKYVSNTDDFYLCSAKKYYKYFTGVDVQLIDKEKANTAKALHQNQVINLSKTLRSSNSVRATLKAIFDSAPYKNRDFLARELANEP